MAVPEFILKKLIVPGSFRLTSNGFTFRVLNNFAAATISKFCILIGDQPVLGSDVRITSAGQTPMLGERIIPTNPMLLPVGLEITVDVKAQPGKSPITLIAMTKEVGEIKVTLTSGASKKKSKKLKPSLFTLLSQPKVVEVSVQRGSPNIQASRFILGQFIEHLERCVYDGVWSSDGRKLRTDTLDLIRQLNPPLIRYPGGNFASGYHWEDGIGPYEKRIPRHDAAWQANESNQVGTDEYLAFCEEIGTEPLLVVNDGSGTPEEAARWVAYCNNPSTTEMGMQRAQNGHPTPYGVKYWGIGNEVWGPWQIGTTSAEEYCRRATRFINAMKAVDPEIKIVAVGHSPITDQTDDEGYLWNETVLKNIGDQINYLSWHIYQPDKSGWQEVYDAKELYKSICAAHLDIENIVDRVESQIIRSGHPQVLQAVDEWNLWLPPRQKNVSMHRVTYTMRDALYAAAVLMTFYKHGDTVGMANLAQLVNVLPLIETNADTAIATAMFYPFVLFNHMQPVVLPVEIASETFTSLEQANNLLGHENVPFVDALATVDPGQKKLTVLIINRYPFTRVKINLRFEDLQNLIPVHAMQVNAPAPDSFNSFEKPNQVKITDAPHPVIKDGHANVTLKPCSIYLVVFNI